ncbi:MAG: hypothetical protein O7C75_16995 [Verrucomicrobia bacterium]|nr:hypothetical protein [Verrucomicrobiota bacterium]
MQIPIQIAEYIATQAVAEPYRQTLAMDTIKFAQFLKDRGISISWRAIDQLARDGVIRPILVFESIGTTDSDRYAQVKVGYDVPAYVDLGLVVGPQDIHPVPFFDKLPDKAGREMVWHPFQLWEFAVLARHLDLPISPELLLCEIEDAKKTIEKQLSTIRTSLSKFANDPKRLEFLGVLGVMLAAEPLVITHLDSTLSLNAQDPDESLSGYFEWRQLIDTTSILTNTSADIDLLKKWQRSMAVDASLKDPVAKWRTLIRFAPRGKRKDFRWEAAKAEELYYDSEILRRFLENHLGLGDLLEEDDAVHGAQGPVFKQDLYGSPRTTDFNRSVFRNVVRQFHLDPQPRLRWLVEGSTEKAYVERYAELLNVDLEKAGIEVIDMHGLGGLEGDRVSTFLRISSEEEVFAFVSIDLDNIQKNPGILQTYAEAKLLPSGFKIFDPDFEQDNFTFQELAVIANALALEQGLTGNPITEEEIRHEKDFSGKAIADVIIKLSSLPDRMWYLEKGQDWGKALANFAFFNPNKVGTPAFEREIVRIFTLLLRAQTSNYRFTLSGSHVDKDGNVVTNGTG